MPSVCLYVSYMHIYIHRCVSCRTSAWTLLQILFTLYKFIHLKVDAYLIWILQLQKYKPFKQVPKRQNGTLTENGSRNYDYISEVYGGHIPEWNHMGSIFRKLNADVLEIQMKNSNLIINGFTDIDYIVVCRLITR
jgi:hypothetical protein